MMAFLNNPAMLILSIEALVILVVLNSIFVSLSVVRTKKTKIALTTLVAQIQKSHEHHKEQLIEMVMSPELRDPEAMQLDLQAVLDSQTQLFKNICTAIRTQDVEDVSKLSTGVNSLFSAAVKLGRATEKDSTDDAVEVRLMEENTNLSSKLETAAFEMEKLMGEYQAAFPDKEFPGHDSASDKDDDAPELIENDTTDDEEFPTEQDDTDDTGDMDDSEAFDEVINSGNDMNETLELADDDGIEISSDEELEEEQSA